jgi:hypothetical protein
MNLATADRAPAPSKVRSEAGVNVCLTSWQSLSLHVLAAFLSVDVAVVVVERLGRLPIR